MGDPYHVVLVDARGGEYALEKEEIAAASGELVIGRCRTEEEAIEFAREADVVLNISQPVSRGFLKSLQRCVGIVRYGVGVENIDLDAATEEGIIIAHVPDYGADEVATHALALLLAAARKVVRFDRAIRRGDRRSVPLPPIGPIEGETLGLIGFGRIARALARKVQGLGIAVVAYDPYVNPEEATAAGVSLEPWQDVLAQADYLSLHVVLTPETLHWLNAERIALMKPTAYIINTSRGSAIDEAALLDALREQRLAGAALDVLEQEPPSADNPLLTLDTVIVTPHIGYYSERSILRLARGVGQSAAALLRAELPAHVANPAVIPRRRLAQQKR